MSFSVLLTTFGLVLGSCLAVVAQEPLELRLWPDSPPGGPVELEPEADLTQPDDGLVAGRRVIRLGRVSDPTLTVYPAPADKATGTAVIVCPGGGHHILAMDLEGTEVCEWLNEIGVTAVLLKYRVPARDPNRKWLSAVQDAQRCVSLVRQHAEDWGIDPSRIGILGFSAGGQTAGYTCVLHRDRQYEAIDTTDTVSCRPDFAVLVYPAWLVNDEATALREDVRLDADTPTMFFAHAWDDPIRVENSLLMAAGLKQAGVPCEAHVYAFGGHGFGLRPTDEPCSRWPQACTQWMRRNGWLESTSAER